MAALFKMAMFSVFFSSYKNYQYNQMYTKLCQKQMSIPL